MIEELRRLRWLLGFGAVLLALAPAAARGLGFGHHRPWLDLLLRDGAPGIVFGLLVPLVAALATIETFTSKRDPRHLADADAPARRRFFGIRLAGVVVGALALAAAALLGSLGAGAFSATPSPPWLLTPLGLAFVVLPALLGVAGTLLPATVGLRSLAALPIGLLFALLPLLPPALLAILYRAPGVGPDPVALATSAAAVAFYLVLGHIAAAHRESGRTARLGPAGLLLGALAVMGLALVFWAIPRAQATYAASARPARLVVSPDATRAVLLSRGAFLVDLAEGRVLAQLAVFAYDACWSDDGQRLVVNSGSGAAGGLLRRGQLALYDRNGAALGTRGEPGGTLVLAPAFAGDRLYFSRSRPRQVDSELVSVDGRTLEGPSTLHFAAPGPEWRLFTRSTAGRPARAPWLLAERHARADVAARRFDPLRGTIDETPLFTSSGTVYISDQTGFAPGAPRAIVQSGAGEARGLAVRDLETGRELATLAEGTTYARWLGDDELVWVERDDENSRIVGRFLGAPPRILAVVQGRIEAFEVAPPPARRAAYRVVDRGGRTQRVVAHDLASGVALDLPLPRRLGQPKPQWAGPDRLALHGHGGSVLYAFEAAPSPQAPALRLADSPPRWLLGG